MKFVAIVDAYSSGQFLAAEFISRGYKCIAIHSCTKIPSVYIRSFYSSNFEKHFSFSGDNFDELISALRSFKCTAVVPGAESGVLLANRLAADLGLACCSADKIDALRDKFLMQTQISKDGLRSIHQFKASSIPELKRKLPESSVGKTVVKPVSSCGTEGVFFCNSNEEIIIAAGLIMDKINCFGSRNDSILVQEYVSGTEYVVDTVSLGGKHYVVSTSRYEKANYNGAIVYVEEVFINPADPEMVEIIDYAIKVLDSLGINFGAGHMEIMVDEKGPVLIEVGARLHGAKAPRAAQYSSNVSQIDLLVDAAIDTDRFQRRTAEPPKIYKYSKAVSLLNSKTGTVVDIPGKEWAHTLSSYTTAFWNIAVGDRIEPTRNLFDSPGGIFLANESKSALESDTQLIRKMEAEGQMWVVS